MFIRFAEIECLTNRYYTSKWNNSNYSLYTTSN